VMTHSNFRLKAGLRALRDYERFIIEAGVAPSLPYVAPYPDLKRQAKLQVLTLLPVAVQHVSAP
jgi:hypothetical protein